MFGVTRFDSLFFWRKLDKRPRIRHDNSVDSRQPPIRFRRLPAAFRGRSMTRLTRLVAVFALTIPSIAIAQPAKNLKVEPPTAAITSINVYPAKIDLDGPRDEQRIGVVGQYADNRTWELTSVAKYTSANRKIAEVDAAGIVRPIGDGQTTITVTANGKTQTLPVKVTKATTDIPVSFTREI